MQQPEGRDPGPAGGAAQPSPGLEDSHPSPQMKTLTVMVAAPGTRNPGPWSPALLGKKEEAFVTFPSLPKRSPSVGSFSTVNANQSPVDSGRTIRLDAERGKARG